MSSKIIRLNKVRKYIAQMIRDYLMHKRALLKMDPQVPSHEIVIVFRPCIHGTAWLVKERCILLVLLVL